MPGEHEEMKHACVPSEVPLDVSPSASSNIMRPTKKVHLPGGPAPWEHHGIALKSHHREPFLPASTEPQHLPESFKAAAAAE